MRMSSNRQHKDIFDVLQPGEKELPFDQLSEVINTSESEEFTAGVKRLPNSSVLHVYKSLQAALLNRNAGELDRQKCIQFMTCLVKLKFDYLQNVSDLFVYLFSTFTNIFFSISHPHQQVPNLKQELSTMQTVIEQRSRIVKDSHRILGRLQLILNKNSSPSGSSSNDLDSSYSTSSDNDDDNEIDTDEIEDIEFDDDDDDDMEDDDEDSSFEENGVGFRADDDDDDDDDNVQNGHMDHSDDDNMQNGHMDHSGDDIDDEDDDDDSG